MSLGDHLRYLRAVRGGPGLIEVSQAIGVASAARLGQIEQRYSDPSDDATLEKLAVYYAVPVEELQWHRARLRRNLALHVHAAMQAGQQVTLRLRTGEAVSGHPVWWDLGAIGLQPADGGALLVIQRHAVIDWEGSQT